MNTRAITLRKRWLAMGAVAILAALALAAGTLFAANERQRPELPETKQQPVESATGPAVAVESPVDPPAPERVFTQANDDQQEVDLPPITKEPPKYPNLDSNLNRLVEQDQSQTQPAGQQSRMTNSIGDGSASSANPVLVTFYIEPEKVAAMRRFLENNDVFVRNVGEDYIEAHVPPALLPAASELPGVLRVNTVIPPEPAQSQSRVISQGVGLHSSDAWHNAGYRGQGVKIGIIDSGFERFSELQQGGELPPNVFARCYFEGPQPPSSQLSDCAVGSEHGTAVAETVIDVTPDAELYISNPISGGDLRKTVEWMAGEGVQVINYSIGHPPDGPGDGTSPFSNSPLRTIDVAVDSGITWVIAAGNGARNVWYGTFSDPDNDGVHNFAPKDEGNTLEVREGERVRAFMRWDDSWGQADCDLDLVLTKRVGNQNAIAVIDDINQDGSQGSNPLAIIVTNEATASQAGLYALWIDKHECANDPKWIQLFMWDPGPLEHYSPDHHMGNPEESRNPGALAVGATHYWDTNTIASYSSRGPTVDGRTKPEITGVACGSSTVYPPETVSGNPCWFPGTSQAAPHVAGLAALVKQRTPDFSPSQVAHFMTQNAQDRGPAGPDNTWGHGFAALPNPSLEVEIPPPPPTSNIEVRLGNNTGEVVISWDAVDGASHYRIGYVNMEVDYNLAKASCTGEWIEAFVYIDVNARNIPVSNGRAEYTLRRVSPGARHAFTVLTSNSFVDSGSGGSVSSEFFWASPRWKFLPGRDTLPAGITLPSGECTP